MASGTPFSAPGLDQAGLNRQHIFDFASLPEKERTALAAEPWVRQLILIGHAGCRLWDCVQAAGMGGEHPIDDFCRLAVDRWFTQDLPHRRYRLIYPGDDTPIGLQALGQLAGWHHSSPFRVGVDPQWGSWFAYRAVILADTDFLPSTPVDRENPCARCADRPCISACPAQAAGDEFRLERCLDERLRPGSACALRCLSRLACPVGREHRYSDAQIRHSYAISLRWLQAWRQEASARTPASATQPRATR